MDTWADEIAFTLDTHTHARTHGQVVVETIRLNVEHIRVSLCLYEWAFTFHRATVSKVKLLQQTVRERKRGGTTLAPLSEASCRRARVAARSLSSLSLSPQLNSTPV